MIGRAVADGLQSEGHAVDVVRDGAAAEIALLHGPYDLAVLDLGLPRKDGFDVLKSLRHARVDVPVLIITARDAVADRVAGLDHGADDYMVKPFGVEELLARVRLALRHRLQQQGLGPVFRLHDLSLDFMAHRVTVGGAEVKLSKREFELLRLLAEHAGKVMTHRQILTAVWGEAHSHDVEYLRVYVRQLRSKLGDDPANPWLIETEPGVGYRVKAE